MKLDHIKACQKSPLLVYQKLIWAWNRGQKVKFCPKIKIFGNNLKFVQGFISSQGLVRLALVLNQSNCRINLHDFKRTDRNLRHKEIKIFILNGSGQAFQGFPIFCKIPIGTQDSYMDFNVVVTSLNEMLRHVNLFERF